MENIQHRPMVVNNPDCLRDLLETCYDEFKMAVKGVEYLLSMLKLVQEHQAPLQLQQQEYIATQTVEQQRGMTISVLKMKS